MTAPLPEWLVNYVLKRDQQRADAVNAVLGSLTERERRLVRDAAVMGYVRGTMHPKNERIPQDSSVMAGVIGTALAHPDLYPVLTGVRPCGDCSHPGASRFPSGTGSHAAGSRCGAARAPFAEPEGVDRG